MIYRPHVDGLRALAVLFVLFFHAGLKLFPSGFVGVDIFFVISGFLITSLIHSSLQANNFSFSEFYNRRLWRLQPVFLCLILVTIVISLIYYIPEDLLAFAKSTRKTSLFLSNQYFEQITHDYFSANANHLPLLHTWSLAIEWQCYLFLPLAFYLLHRLVGEKHLAKIVYLLTLAFFALALYYSSAAPQQTYYQFLSRIFEFLIGSCVALAPKPFRFNRLFLNLISLAALASLFYIASLSGINLGFPNWYSFILCLATAILIASGEQESKPFCVKGLSLKPIVFIGLLSYSLYIWHWPVFVLIRYLNIEETPSLTAFAFGLVALIAYLSWRFIERPSRKLSKLKFSYSLAYLFILPTIILHLSGLALKKTEGLPQRFNESKRIYALLKQYNSTQRHDCHHKAVNENANCHLGANSATSRKGLMIGDSFSNHHWQFMDLLAKQANVSLFANSTAGCLSLPGILQADWLPGMKGIYQFCQNQNNLYYKMIRENHYDFVILGEYWYYYLMSHIVNSEADQRSPELTKERIAKGLDEALQLIIATGAKPIIIKAIALSGTDTHHCFFQHMRRREAYQPERCDFNLDPLQSLWFDELFAKMQAKYSQLILIDPTKVQCPKGLCKADINGVPVFRDENHLTDYASYVLAESYLKLSKNPLLG